MDNAGTHIRALMAVTATAKNMTLLSQ